MPKLLFFSRVALLCNICFVLALLVRYIPFIRNGVVSSTIIIMGNILSIMINILVNLLYFALLLKGTSRIMFVPKWIMIVNFLFLIMQVILLIK